MHKYNKVGNAGPFFSSFYYAKSDEVYRSQNVCIISFYSLLSHISQLPRPSPPSLRNYFVRLRLWCAQKRV